MVTRDSLLRMSNLTKIMWSIGSLLFFLVISNGAWPQKTPDAGAFLAEKHKTAGIECAQCHKDKPSEPVPIAACAGCHVDLAKSPVTKENKPNPHNAHIPFPDCSSCHHAHKASENQCDTCHNFGYKIR